VQQQQQMQVLRQAQIVQPHLMPQAQPFTWPPYDARFPVGYYNAGLPAMAYYPPPPGMMPVPQQMMQLQQQQMQQAQAQAQAQQQQQQQQQQQPPDVAKQG